MIPLNLYKPRRRRSVVKTSALGGTCIRAASHSNCVIRASTISRPSGSRMASKLEPRLLKGVGSVSLADEVQHCGRIAIDGLSDPAPGLLLQICDRGILLKEAAAFVLSAAATGTGVIAPDFHGRHFGTRYGGKARRP